MSTRRSRTAGLVPGVSRTRGGRYGRGSRFRPGKPMPKPRTMASRSGPNSRRTIRRFWCWTANSRRSRSTRCFSNRKADSPGMTRPRKNLELVVGSQSPFEVASAVAYLLGDAAAAVKPARINLNSASCGGGFGGRDHTPVPALRRAGGDVLRQSSGPAREQPLRAVSIGDQAARLQDPHADRG